MNTVLPCRCAINTPAKENQLFAALLAMTGCQEPEIAILQVQVLRCPARALRDRPQPGNEKKQMQCDASKSEEAEPLEMEGLENRFFVALLLAMTGRELFGIAKKVFSN